jgi:general secretion pathway protein J
MTDREQSQAGFTMLEMVVVLALFALIATFSLQALSGTLRARDRLLVADENSKNLARTLAQMRADMNAVVGVTFTMPSGDVESAVEIADLGNAVALSVSGRFDFGGDETIGLGRVVWRLDQSSGTLSRQVWPVLNPASSFARGPEVVMMTGVSAITVRRLINTSVWETGRDRSIFGAASTLPKALDIVVTSNHWGAISTKVGFP